MIVAVAVALLSALVPVVSSNGPASVAAPSCPADAPSGDLTVPVTSQGSTYRVLVHAPPVRPARAQALLFNLHGSTQSGSAHRSSTGTDSAADAHGFVVAYPDGGIVNTPAGQAPVPLPAGYFWNIPGVPLVGGVPVPPGSRDDVRFIADAIDAIASVLCIDRSSVYATGASGGGRMASLLACALSNRVAAVAPVMGVRAGNPDPQDPSRPDPSTCRPARPVPVIAIHGEKDTVDPYGGGGSAYWGYSVPVAMSRWARLDGCTRRQRDRRLTPTVTVLTWGGCRNGATVALYRSSIGGHTWPGRPESSLGGATGEVDMSMNANEVIWRTLSRHRLDR